MTCFIECICLSVTLIKYLNLFCFYLQADTMQLKVTKVIAGNVIVIDLKVEM